MALKPGQKHYYEVKLHNPTTNKVYTGKGPAEGAARAKAQVKAITEGGEHPGDLVELEVLSLVGPNPQTFKGNSELPKG